MRCPMDQIAAQLLSAVLLASFLPESGSATPVSTVLILARKLAADEVSLIQKRQVSSKLLEALISVYATPDPPSKGNSVEVDVKMPTPNPHHKTPHVWANTTNNMKGAILLTPGKHFLQPDTYIYCETGAHVLIRLGANWSKENVITGHWKQIPFLSTSSYQLDFSGDRTGGSNALKIYNHPIVETLYKYTERFEFDNVVLDQVALNNAKQGNLDLNGAELNGADLTGAHLRMAHLTGAKLRMARLTGADLSGADLSKADLKLTRLAGSNLARAHMAKADLLGADLEAADLSGTDLTEAYMIGTDLRKSHLSGADLTRGQLKIARLNEADLKNAHLTNANLSGADLSGADLSDADLTGTDLSGADLTGTDLEGAVLKGAYYTGEKPTGIDLTKYRVVEKKETPSDHQPKPAPIPTAK